MRIYGSDASLQSLLKVSSKPFSLSRRFWFHLWSLFSTPTITITSDSTSVLLNCNCNSRLNSPYSNVQKSTTIKSLKKQQLFFVIFSETYYINNSPVSTLLLFWITEKKCVSNDLDWQASVCASGPLLGSKLPCTAWGWLGSAFASSRLGQWPVN